MALVLAPKLLHPRPKEAADLISRTAIAAVVCLKTGANAHRLILFAENGLNQQSPKAMGVEFSTVEVGSKKSSVVSCQLSGGVCGF